MFFCVLLFGFVSLLGVCVVLVCFHYKKYNNFAVVITFYIELSSVSLVGIDFYVTLNTDLHLVYQTQKKNGLFSLSIYPWHNQGNESSSSPYDADHEISRLLTVYFLCLTIEPLEI